VQRRRHGLRVIPGRERKLASPEPILPSFEGAVDRPGRSWLWVPGSMLRIAPE
jgi:hypothetical protein